MIISMSEKPLLKFALFSFLLAILGIFIDAVITFIIMPALCDANGYAYYCEFNAFGLATMIFGLLRLPLVALSLVSLIAHLFYKGSVSPKLKVAAIFICVVVFVIPDTLAFWGVVRPQAGGERGRVEYELRQKQECDEYRARAVNEPTLVPPLHCR